MPLDVFQQVFLLSLSANLVNGVKGTQKSLQKMLQDTLNVALATVPGWKLAWGPVVWKHNPDDATTGPDNSWFIAHHPDLQFEDGSKHPVYVIAIAGTPRESEYVWINENFAVNAVVDFNAWVKGGIKNTPVVVPAAQVVQSNAYIAKGTVNAVHLLLTTPAPEGALGAGTTLLDFIAKVGGSGNSRIITTGHSLGGALSPSLALALISSKTIPADRSLTYPSAGPSPGNKAFTELFTASLPPHKRQGAKSYQGWNLNLVNTLDIVPQAWAAKKSMSPEQNLGNIPTIYGKPALLSVKVITIGLILQAMRSGVLYLPIKSQYFTSTPPPSTPKSLEEFMQLVSPNHVQAYIDEVGVVIPTPHKSQMLNLGLTLKEEEENRLNYPVIAGFEWALEHPEQAKRGMEMIEGSAEGKALAVELE